MKRTTLAIAIFSAIALSACGNSNNGEKSGSTSQPEQDASSKSSSLTDQTIKASKENWKKTQKLGRETTDAVTTTSQEIYENAMQAASDAGNAVSEKADDLADAAREKSADLLNRMNNE
jgi:gas vesicle protein